MGCRDADRRSLRRYGRAVRLRPLTLVLLVPALLGAGEARGAETVRSYASRPDLKPVVVRVVHAEAGLAPGPIFIAPKRGPGQGGPLIIGENGQPIWFKPLPGGRRATDFRVQQYAGRPVLTWWEGIATGGRGAGEGVIADESYHVIARVKAGNGERMDLHEFTLTPRGTALILAYRDRSRDLRAWGGPKDGEVTDGIVQEVDVATGAVLFQWHAMGAVRLDESYKPARGREAWDAFHLNSVDEDADGNLIVSARHTRAVYKIDRATGRIVWRLGGKRSSFQMGRGTHFALQHDARAEADGTIRIFDNSSRKLRVRSRAIWIRLDTAARTATLVRERHHPDHVLAGTQGDVQVLPNGDTFLGWGSQGRVSELGPDGRLLLDLRLPHRWDTYRAYRAPWVGRPTTAPAVDAETRQDGGTTVYASWNGATEVAAWQVLVGDTAGAMQVAATVPRSGFETRVRLPDLAPEVAVRALDAGGAVLGQSRVVTS
jgi:Arylsulfotransferase (ASST)